MMPSPVCHAVLPAETTIRRGQSLHVLLVMESPEATAAPVRFWGNDGSGWRNLLEESRDFPAGEHVHLYFNLPADRFTAPFWGGTAPEEVSLVVGDAPPEAADAGVLIFVEDGFTGT